MRNSYLGSLFIFAMAKLFFACTETKLAAGETSKTKVDKVEVVENEGVDPPSNIAGAYLHCAAELKPSVGKREATFGCRMEDVNGKKVSITAVAARSTFSYRAPADKTLQVQVKALPDDPRYHALYLVIAGSQEDAEIGYKNLKVYVDLQDVAGSGGNSAVGAVFSEIERDAAAIPEARTTDYEAIRTEMVADIENGQISTPL